MSNDPGRRKKTKGNKREEKVRERGGILQEVKKTEEGTDTELTINGHKARDEETSEYIRIKILRSSRWG